MNYKCIKALPTSFSKENIEFELCKFDNFFYDFEFSNGSIIESKDKVANIFHKTRAELIFPFLDTLYESKWDQKRCLDIACHQGWFSSQLAVRGAHEVIGVDIREVHLDIAEKIKEISNLKNLEYKNKNLFDLRTDELGEFDLVFLLGILYHIDNPLGALKIARSLTKEYCIIETQVAKGQMKTECMWGSSSDVKEGECIAVIDSDDIHVEKNKNLVLVPTLNALYKMLYGVGFDRIYLIVPPQNMYEQYSNFDRVIIIAQVLIGPKL